MGINLGIGTKVILIQRGICSPHTIPYAAKIGIIPWKIGVPTSSIGTLATSAIIIITIIVILAKIHLLIVVVVEHVDQLLM